MPQETIAQELRRLADALDEAHQPKTPLTLRKVLDDYDLDIEEILDVEIGHAPQKGVHVNMRMESDSLAFARLDFEVSALLDLKGDK